MRTIYKYRLDDKPKQRLWMHQGSKIVSALSRSNVINIWCECDTKTLKEYRTIHIFETGNCIPEDFKLVFINTVKLYNAKRVVHVYEEIK